MFQDIRKKSSSVLVTLMLSAIILTFVISFGPEVEGGCSGVSGYVANVNGEIITMPDFRFAYNNHYEYYQRLFGEFNQEMAKQYKLHERTLDSLIGDILLSQEADKKGFRVAEEELRQQILETPYFQKNGVFDRDTYNQVVQVALNTTVAKFEKKMEREILAGKLRNFILESGDLSNTEIREEYINNNEKLDAFVYSFKESSLKNEIKEEIISRISDKETEQYLENNLNTARLHYQDNIAKYTSDKEEGKEITFEDVKLTVTRDIILKDKITELIKNDSERLIVALKGNPDFSKEDIDLEFSSWNIERTEVPAITKNSKFIPGVGFSPLLVSKLFEAKDGILNEVVETEESIFAVAGIAKYFPADMGKFESEKDQIKDRMRYAKSSQLLQDYIENIRENSDIQINPNFMKIYEGE
jgi:hypothetical protein